MEPESEDQIVAELRRAVQLGQRVRSYELLLRYYRLTVWNPRVELPLQGIYMHDFALGRRIADRFDDAVDAIMNKWIAAVGGGEPIDVDAALAQSKIAWENTWTAYQTMADREMQATQRPQNEMHS